MSNIASKPTPTAESVALDLLKVIIDRFGVPMVLEVLNISDGKSAMQAIDDISILCLDVIRAITTVIETATVREAIKAGFAAADAQADALEAAKFGPKP